MKQNIRMTLNNKKEKSDKKKDFISNTIKDVDDDQLDITTKEKQIEKKIPKIFNDFLKDDTTTTNDGINDEYIEIYQDTAKDDEYSYDDRIYNDIYGQNEIDKVVDEYWESNSNDINKKKQINNTIKNNKLDDSSSDDDTINILTNTNTTITTTNNNDTSTTNMSIYQDAGNSTEEQSWAERQQRLRNRKEIKHQDTNNMDQPPFRKNFYIEHPSITSLTDEQVKYIREIKQENMHWRGKDIPKPISRWVHCGFPSVLDDQQQKYNFKEPFPIQCQVLPIIMSGRDCLACAKTGSGKTLGFVLPMIRHVMDQPKVQPGEGFIGLIMTPTRELSVQIYEDVKKFSKPFSIRSVAVYGGNDIATQIKKLKSGIEIVIGTPGRLIDILSTNNSRITNLLRVTYVVLDEADRMFDMGFAPQIERIQEHTRNDRQTLLFSATFPKVVENIARKILLHSPIELIIGTKSVVSDTIKQIVEVLTPDIYQKKLQNIKITLPTTNPHIHLGKFIRQLEILEEWKGCGKILIFVDKKEIVNELFGELFDRDYPILAIHGGMDQLLRDTTISDFKQRQDGILISTSVMSRGFDVKDLVLVINYSVPYYYEDYVHRVGRTGRATTNGTAITFITPEEEEYSIDLVKALTLSKQEIPEKLLEIKKNFETKIENKEAIYYRNRGFYNTSGFRFDEQENTKNLYSLLSKEHSTYGDDVEDIQKDTIKDTGNSIVKQSQKNQNIDITTVNNTVNKKLKIIDDNNTIRGDSTTTNISESQETQLAIARARAQKAKEAVVSGSVPNEQIQDPTKKEEAVNALAQQVNPDHLTPGKELNEKQIEQRKKRAQAVVQAISREQPQSGNLDDINIPYDELEINEYPISVRSKLSRRENYNDIIEAYNVIISLRGVYTEPGRKPPDGERRLYLLIQGYNMDSVRNAKNELFRRYEDAALSPHTLHSSTMFGKFQV